MGPGQIESIVDIIGIGTVAHGGSSTGKAELVRSAHHGNISLSKKAVCQLQSHLKLATLAAHQQCAEKIHSTAFQPLLHLIHRTAIRRTSVVGIILAAEIILAELTEDPSTGISFVEITAA